MRERIRDIILSPQAFVTFVAVLSCVFIIWGFYTVKLLRFDFIVLAWLVIFSLMIINVSEMLVCSLYALVFKPVQPPEYFLTTIPATAIVYTIRAESCGLYERFNYTLKNNYLENVDLWILSGDASGKYIEYERRILNNLRKKYGAEKIHYLHSYDPKVKKREILDLWLETYGDQYKYFISCDADSFLPKNTVLRLLRKAEHPDHKDVGIFQTGIYVVNAKTYYSYFQVIGNIIGHKLYNCPKYLTLKTFMFWGHNALVRVKSFKKIKIPPGVLSHDIWETVYLEKAGFRTAFCQDVITYEETPSNYLESLRRESRWIRGNVEAWRLLFTNQISLGTRYNLFFGLYRYFITLIFFFWVLFGIYIENSTALITLYGPRYMLSFVTLTIIFAHKLIVCKSLKDIGGAVYEIVISTIVCQTNIFYTSLTLMTLPFKRNKQWIAMKKNPFEEVSLIAAVKQLWPSTIVGFILLLVALAFAPMWGLYSIPIIFSFILGIPVAYYTSKLRGGKKWQKEEYQGFSP